jgi:hypothetical protein
VCTEVQLSTHVIVWQIDEKQHVEDFRAVTTVILQMQRRWIDWLAKATGRRRAEADMKR